MTTTIAASLAQSDVFESLDQPELDRLAAACHVRSYGAGELVFLRGDHGDRMYVVAAGTVDISIGITDGRDVLLAILGPPQSFGELAVIDGGSRVATVRARQQAMLVGIPRAAVSELIARRPSVARALLTAMAALVRRLDDLACDASLLDLPRRVEKFLLAAATCRTGVPSQRSSGYVPVHLPLTQNDLARHVGGSRQQVNRILMGLEAAGSIERLGHRIVGIRPELLFSGGRSSTESG